jgi:hypothetical protein
MKNSLFIFALLSLVFVACDSGSGGKVELEEPLFGWRSAGLEFPDAEGTGGAHKLIHVAHLIGSGR